MPAASVHGCRAEALCAPESRLPKGPFAFDFKKRRVTEARAGLPSFKYIVELACEEEAYQCEVEEQENANQSAHGCFGAFQVLWRQFSLVQRFVLPCYLIATMEQPLRTARLKQNTVTISTLDNRRQG